MKAAVIAFTAKGAAAARRVRGALEEMGIGTFGYASQKYAQDAALEPFSSVHELMQTAFDAHRLIVFVGACGIAVRAIAPHLKDKTTDPAVLVLDEKLEFIISLLSGHLGGANEYARRLGAMLGAVPVITTATDVQGVFAVDSWAARAGLVVLNKEGIKEVSARLLEGRSIGVRACYPARGTMPKGLLAEGGEYEIVIAPRAEKERNALFLAPKNLIVGCGCRRGVPVDRIERAMQAAFEAHDLDTRRVARMCSIDLKADEQGLIAFARAHAYPISFFSASELENVQGTFTASETVLRVTGVDNVCERAATLGGGKGRLIVKKTSLDGVTIAVFEKECEVNWDA